MNEHRRAVVVGIGDNGPSGLTARALDVVREAEVLCGGQRHLAMFPEHTAERLPITGDLDAVLSRLDRLVESRRVAVLASGDPCYYGIGPLVVRRLGQERVEIIPSVGAIPLAFARMGEAWHDATIVSAHGRPLSAAVRRARGSRKLAFLTDEVNTPAVIAQALLDAGALGTAWVFEHLGGPRERAFSGRLADVAARSFAPLNVLALPSLVWPRRQPGFGRNESEFLHREGLVTKAEVRAVSLSKLRLPPDGMLWDVGAGCGSVTIEAAALMPRGTVIAVERSADQLALLRQNVAAAGLQDVVELVHGEAPSALHDLGSPTAVFVGGSGGALEPILDVSYERLMPGGRLVVNVATLEHLGACARWAAAGGTRPEIVQVSVSRGTEILGLTRLEALNPIFVVTIERAG